MQKGIICVLQEFGWKMSKEAERQLVDLLSELGTSVSTNQLSELYGETYSNGGEGGPYDWQKEFHDHGFDHKERAIIAGNRVGKTRTAAAEVAIHLTGYIQVGGLVASLHSQRIGLLLHLLTS